MTNDYDLKDPNFFAQLATFFGQYFARYDSLLTAEAAEEKYGIPAQVVTDALKDENFRKAIKEFGVPLERYESGWQQHALSAQQLMLANTLLDLVDTRTHKKKMQDMGISTKQYNDWLNDPVFSDYLHSRAEKLIGVNQHEINTALMDKVRAGDIKAIAYVNEMTGRFTPQRANAAGVDVHALVVKIIEIIDIVVTNKDEKLRISQELKKLIAANNAASSLLGMESPVGEIGVKEMAALAQSEEDDLTADGEPEVVAITNLKELGL